MADFFCFIYACTSQFIVFYAFANIPCFRYYEGQLTLITEEDNETKEKLKLPGNVTQAAAKVCLCAYVSQKYVLTGLIIIYHIRESLTSCIFFLLLEILFALLIIFSTWCSVVSRCLCVSSS